MGDAKSKPDGEHINELLSQLKGIFGQLSESEQEESKSKITPPAAAAASPAPAQQEVPPQEGAPAPSETEPVPYTPVGETAPPAEDAPAPFVLSEPVDPTLPPFMESFTPAATAVPEGAALISSAVFYPVGRIDDAKSVAEKIERIVPKFTKVTVVMNVQSLAVIDAKSDLIGAITAHIQDTDIKAVFMLVEKPTDEARRKALAAELESKGIYFHEIPVQQMEKRAFYTDMLLGVVFFFDSRKPAGG